jgi:hypothetical protein
MSDRPRFAKRKHQYTAASQRAAAFDVSTAYLVSQSSHQIEHLQKLTTYNAQAVSCMQQLAGARALSACSALREAKYELYCLSLGL